MCIDTARVQPVQGRVCFFALKSPPDSQKSGYTPEKLLFTRANGVRAKTAQRTRAAPVLHPRGANLLIFCCLFFSLIPILN